MILMHHRPQSHIEVYVIHSQRAAPCIAITLICTMIPKVHIIIEIGIGIILRLCTKACFSSIVTGRIASEFRMNPFIASIERQLRHIQVRLPVYSGIGIHIITLTGIAHTYKLVVRIQPNVLIITDIRMMRRINVHLEFRRFQLRLPHEVQHWPELISCTSLQIQFPAWIWFSIRTHFQHVRLEIVCSLVRIRENGIIEIQIESM